MFVMCYVVEDGKVIWMYDWVFYLYFKDGYVWEGGVKYMFVVKDGSLVGVVIWYLIIFNLKKVLLKGDDVELWLFVVVFVLVLKEKFMKVFGVMESWLSVWVKVKIDVVGVLIVIGFDNLVYEDFCEVIECILFVWKFVLVCKGGIVVELEILVVFVVMWMLKWNLVGFRVDKLLEVIL